VQYRGPTATDFDNVYSLNAAFIRLLKRDADARKCLGSLPAGLADCLQSLTAGATERLASTPFLLLSFRERDDDLWDVIFSGGPDRDLFAVPEPASDDLRRLISAGLGFIWQLAKQNPYAARLVCGASLHWCEQLTERTLFQILATAGTLPGILSLRCGNDAALWSKLLAGGISREKQVRRAAHISALQSIITRTSMPDRKKWAAAACAVRTRTLKVADETGS
jgi:hypothetical protein